MKGKNIFKSKKSFDLEGVGVPLVSYENNIVLKDFEVYYSRKYGSSFTVILTEQGDVIYTWSGVIADKFSQLAEMEEKDWKGLVLKKVVKKSSSSNRQFHDLEVVEE